MTAAHRRRGAETERMIVRWAREHGYPGAERTVRTGYRTVERTLADEGDIALCPGLIGQSKALRPANAAERAVPGWLAETEAQRTAAGAAVGLLIVRRDGTADVGEWWAWLYLHDLLETASGRTPERIAPYPVFAPVRLLVADAVTLLRGAGWGEPL